MSDGGMKMDMPMPMSNDSSSMESMDMMHTSFYWGKDVTVLFSGWPERNSGMYVLAFLFVMVLGAVVELMTMLAVVKPGTKPMIGAFIQASVYVVKMCFAYMVMLAVMSYNLGIFIAALAGHGLGFFIVRFRALGKDREHQYLDTTDSLPSKC